MSAYIISVRNYTPNQSTFLFKHHEIAILIKRDIFALYNRLLSQCYIMLKKSKIKRILLKLYNKKYQILFRGFAYIYIIFKQ